jgi:hypothetical protein
MRFRPALPGFFSLLLLSSTLVTVAADPLPGDDQAPQLISTDDGTPPWKNTKDLKAYASRGDPQACFELGTRMVFGDDEVAVDLVQAHALLERAAAGGVAGAHFRLGKLHHDGQGVPCDYDKALAHYTAAARMGVPEAQHNIGSMLVSARGVKRNYVEGLAWLLVAEQSGADSDAPQLVRERLARRPDDIRAAERRAEEINADLAHAVVLAVSTTVPASPPPPSPPPELAPKIEAPVVNPVIEKPAVDSLPPTQIMVPIDHRSPSRADRLVFWEKGLPFRSEKLPPGAARRTSFLQQPACRRLLPLRADVGSPASRLLQPSSLGSS